MKTSLKSLLFKYVLRLGSTTSTSFIKDSIRVIMRFKEKVGKGRQITSY